MINPLLADAVNVPPVQVVDAFGVPATVRPDGNVSVKSSEVADTSALLLSMVNVRVEVSPCAMLLGENALAKVGAVAAVTVSVSDAVPLLPYVLANTLEVLG